VVLLALAAGLAILELVPRYTVGWPHVGGAIALLALTALVAWLSERHAMLALTWANHSTRRSIELADQLRERQFVLNRALRAMDEANSRLAVANQRLAEAFREADDARHAKARFAASISHELRTPLNLIVGFAEVMYNTPNAYEDVILSPSFLLDLGTVYRNAQHLQHLVDDVLDLAQIDAGKLLLEPIETELASLVLESVETVRSLASVRGVDLIVEIAPDLPSIRMDRTRIKQVLLNLISNAARHTERGRITVSTYAEGGEVLCSVQDTGAGIPQEHLGRLFQDFERVASSETSTRGFGLGLVISKRLIQAHGGRIWAESTVGQGSRFTFALPALVEASAEALERRPSQAPAQELSPVLVVTPNLTVSRLISRQMRAFRCVAMADPRLALQQVSLLRPRGVLIDEGLGQDAADTLAQAILGQEADLCPVVICRMSEASQPLELRRAQVFVPKPVSREMLRDVLRGLGGQVETVLVVDDDEDVLRLLGHYLADDPSRPYRLLVAHNGREALDIMAETEPDLLIVDLLMPVMDGYALLRELEAMPALADVPVVVISGQDALAEPQEIEGWTRLWTGPGMGATRFVRGVEGLFRGLQGQDEAPLPDD
jgi:signal transduction histidine kinase/CheY-like chemotaxis protein